MLRAATAYLRERLPRQSELIPVGITWSNRTDLIKTKDVRGHIGIVYDFDSLLHAE